MAKPKEIDLHLHSFMRNTSGLSNEHMLKSSIDRMRSELEKAIENNEKELRFIHGRGNGTLKERVYNELGKYVREGDIISFEPSFFNPDIVVVFINY